MGRETDEEGIDRREWIAAGLRYGALVGISLFVAVMAVKRAREPGDSACRVRLGCRQCPAWADCRLREPGHRRVPRAERSEAPGELGHRSALLQSLPGREEG